MKLTKAQQEALIAVMDLEEHVGAVAATQQLRAYIHGEPDRITDAAATETIDALERVAKGVAVPIRTLRAYMESRQ